MLRCLPIIHKQPCARYLHHITIWGEIRNTLYQVIFMSACNWADTFGALLVFLILSRNITKKPHYCTILLQLAPPIVYLNCNLVLCPKPPSFKKEKTTSLKVMYTCDIRRQLRCFILEWHFLSILPLYAQKLWLRHVWGVGYNMLCSYASLVNSKTRLIPVSNIT